MQTTFISDIISKLSSLLLFGMLSMTSACRVVNDNYDYDKGYQPNGGDDVRPVSELEPCPPQDPPLDDPYCNNTRCSLQIGSIEPQYLPKGNCCNMVDVAIKSSQLESGQTYDLEYAVLLALPTNNVNLRLDMLIQSLQVRQESGGELLLMRFRDVPRTEDHPRDSEGNPIALPITFEVGPGKLNCDGTFSFFGEKAAPVYEETEIYRNEARWIPRVGKTDFYGFEGEYLFVDPISLSARSDTGWRPKWDKEGVTYEQPSRFSRYLLRNSDLGTHQSCYGSFDAQGEWQPTLSWIVFNPIAEMKQVKVPILGNQTLCGIYALGAGQGDCTDVPRMDWVEKPNAYCDEDGYCWIGNPDDPFYQQFWELTYPEQDGCNPEGDEYTCCDPSAESDRLPVCNAYCLYQDVVIAAVDITDEPVNDPSESVSWATLCED